LLKSEVIYSENVENIFGKRAWVSRSEEIMEKKNGENNANEENKEREEGNTANIEM